MEWEKSGSSQGAGGGSEGGSPKKKGGRGKVIALAVIVLIVIFGLARGCMGGGGTKSEDKKLSWPDSGLATLLPDPPSAYGDILTDTEERLYADFERVSEDDFKAYVDEVKDKGFAVEAKSDTMSYDAFDEEGNKVSLLYFESSESLSVTLDAAMKATDITWPTVGPAALLPAPASLKGKVETDSATFFAAYIAETDEGAFRAYVDAVMSAGFNVDHQKTDTTFGAKNADGVSVRVEYRGNNTMFVKAEGEVAKAEEKPSQDASAAAEQGAAPSTTSGAGDSADFRAMVDSYEAFYNEYVEFMKKYTSEGNPVDMLVDYGSMTKRYAEMNEKMASVDEDSLSAEDYQYFIDAQTRINQKLAELA